MRGPIHPGQVLHLWDHFVLDLKTDDGRFAYLSLYAIAISPGIGPGVVAILAYDLGAGRRELLLGEDVAAALRMRERLRAMSYARASLEAEPSAARFERSIDGRKMTWRIESKGGALVATWSDLRAPFQMLAPAPQLVADEDITCVFVEAGHGRLDTGDMAFDADAVPDEYWRTKVGRPLLACHAALSEIRVRPTSQ